MTEVMIPSRKVPVIGQTGICVIGGSCTGVFAAVRAARLGAEVMIVEKQNRFGGVAVSGMVSIWHSLKDTTFKNRIIAGLTQEIIERLQRRQAVNSHDNSYSDYILNTEELAIELDRLIIEAGVKPLLHTVFTAPYYEDGRLAGVVVENKSGCGVILADYLIDASGDADLCSRAGCSIRQPEAPQPSTTCARFSGWKFPEGFDLGSALRKYGAEYNLPQGFIWGENVPGSDIHMLAGTRIFNCDCADAAGLTAAEIEGRRQVRAITDILRDKYDISGLALQALPSMTGIRESRHIRALYTLTGPDLLNGVRFDDAIANGTYRVDIHQPGRPGIIFRYLNGREVYACPGQKEEESRWREPVDKDPAFYQIPLRCLIPERAGNIIAAGRMLDADQEAFGGARVMVNMNQTGEAAGVAAALALETGKTIPEIPAEKIRQTLRKGGSCII